MQLSCVKIPSLARGKAVAKMCLECFSRPVERILDLQIRVARRGANVYDIR